jgi:hypothetical protein
VAREAPYDASAVVGALQQHGVRFVVIGGVAAIAQGSPLPTEDIDVTPDRAPDNLQSLVGALNDLDAKLRAESGGVDFPIEAQMLGARKMWTLTTRAGDLDLVFEPPGTRGYDDLRRHALHLDLGSGAPVLVAALPDVIRSKEASNREKDRMQLPALRRTLEIVRRREREQA